MGDRIGFGPRLGAFLIDGVVIAIAGWIVGMVVGGLFGAGAGAASGDRATAGAAGVAGAVAGAVIGTSILGLVWMVWEGATGAALGKLLLGIKIKKEDGVNATPDKLFLRAGVKYSSTILGLLAALTGLSLLGYLGNMAGLVIFVGCFFVLGQKRQAFHDMIAKTAVYRK